MDSGDLMSEFLQPNFDVEGYARQLVDSSVSVAEQLALLASGTALLEKQLKDQVRLYILGMFDLGLINKVPNGAGIL